MLHIEKVLTDVEKGRAGLDIQWLAGVWRLTGFVLREHESVGLISRARNMRRLVEHVRATQLSSEMTRLLRARGMQPV